MSNPYRDGTYWQEHPDLHEADADFKFRNFTKLLGQYPDLPIRGIADIGCGSGRMVWLFAQHTEWPCVGVDLDEHIILRATEKYQHKNLSYTTRLAAAENDARFNCAILADVIEHIPDYTSLLQEVKTHFDYQLFNIPLDISLRGRIRNNTKKALEQFGHLHYFNNTKALRMLQQQGFRVLATAYADNIGHEYMQHKTAGHFFKLAGARILSMVLGKELTSQILGCYSLTVLCSNN